MAFEHVFMPVEPIRSSERAAAQFLEMIQSNRLKPGDKLPSEKVLTEMMGISRATLREVLSGLKALGLVVSRSGRGNFVVEDDTVLRNWNKLLTKMRSRSVFLDALEARRALEGEICFLAAQRATDDQLQSVERALLLGKGVTSAVDWKQADYAFHHSLALASGNRLFIHFVEDCFLSLSTTYYDIVRRPEILSKTYEEHCDVFAAVREHNPKKARDRMMSHVETARRNFLAAATDKAEEGAPSPGE